uniref:Uncharacterized protein n=1 Tax=Aquila chrysaetos chrysaetos TaxID=223781 RepID=A0A663E4G0_AQUCH
ETNSILSGEKNQGMGTKSMPKHSTEKVACLGWAKVTLSLRVPSCAFSGATMEKLPAVIRVNNAAWAKGTRHTPYRICSLKELYKLITCVISTYLLAKFFFICHAA